MKIIIIGSGASGLMAANVLSKKGIEVVVLESNSRIGGRIHTFVPLGFTNHIEAGAEFIHGNLPLTLQLMKKAKLPYFPVTGKMYRFENGRMGQNFGRGKAWDEFYDKLESLKKDCTLEAFLQENFAAKKYESLRLEVKNMAQGLDLADISKLSVLSIREEWLSSAMQYRPHSGYGLLLEFLHNNADAKYYQLLLNQHVSKIEWKNGKVKAFTEDRTHNADAIIVTTSLGNLHNNSILFTPEIPQTQKHFDSIGFGQVIKIILEFEDIFWNEKYPDLGFLFTSEGMTFWSQLSEHRPILVGWIGDGYISHYENLPDAGIITMAIAKLTEAFSENNVEVKFKVGIVFRYTKDSQSGGGYSWLMTNSKSAIKEINKGIENTLWFAGEALHPGAEVGTVEAALQSGRYIAKKIIRNFKS